MVPWLGARRMTIRMSICCTGPSRAHLNMMRREALQDELERAFGREVSLTSLDSLQRRAQTSRASRRFYEHIQPDMVRVA